ncbi:MAG: 4Fe-4S dicluster domain-containing protein [FCB group bacterium]|nr:4Fe-4S dicluster domain-containing protein [FCB group bacterium]
MGEYFKNIYTGLQSFIAGLQLSLHHYHSRKKLVATLQYPHEKWPVEERHIGFDLQEYNVVRSRLHVDINDCIGCNQCVRACPVDCITIESVKPPKGSEFDPGTTSNGTQKRMLVARFDIDLTECMFCNLCTYPCPEDCIYMVGGPNSAKHQIEYEYSKRDRKDLIFRFANPSEEEIIAAGGADYLAKKKGLPPPEKPAAEPKAKPKTAEPKINYEPVNAITDRMTRSLAKKAYTAAVRAGKTASETAVAVKQALEEAGKYSSDLDTVMESIGKAELMTQAGPAPEKKVVEQPAGGLDIKLLNDLTDRMTRGIAKKAFMAATREGQDAKAVVRSIQTALEAADKFTDEVKAVLAKLESPGEAPVKPAAAPKTAAPALNIKVLNGISDKMTRGLAKKTFMAAQRAGKSPADIVTEVKETLEDAGKLTPEFAKIIDSLREDA